MIRPPKISEGDYFVRIFSSSAKNSKEFTPIWNDLAQKYEDNDFVKIAKFDCKGDRSFCKEIGIKESALIYHRNGKLMDIYKGDMDLKSLDNYVDTMLNQGKDEF